MELEISPEDLQKLFQINPLADAQLKAIYLERKNKSLQDEIDNCGCDCTNSVLDKRKINQDAVAESRNTKKAQVIT